ncbi:kgd2, partial [Symbiodinium sp. CCMP2456]
EEEWSDKPFTRAYSQMKNTDLGDEHTARMLLSRSWLRDVSIVAHSPVFADEALMIFVQLVLNDMRAYLNGEVVVTAGEDWKPVWEVMGAIATGILLLGGLAGFYLRSRGKSARQLRPSEVELQHVPFRNAS